MTDEPIDSGIVTMVYQKLYEDEAVQRGLCLVESLRQATVAWPCHSHGLDTTRYKHLKLAPLGFFVIRRNA